MEQDFILKQFINEDIDAPNNYRDIYSDVLNGTNNLNREAGILAYKGKKDLEMAKSILDDVYPNVKVRDLDKNEEDDDNYYLLYSYDINENFDDELKFSPNLNPAGTPISKAYGAGVVGMGEEYDDMEIKRYSDEIEETVEKHDTLNQKIFNGDELDPEVKDKLLEIVDRFKYNLEENGIKLDIKDVRIIGSNASYNYTDKSDIDLHIFADLSVYPDQEVLAQKVYDAYKALWNNKFDPIIRGHEVEIYVEPYVGD